MATQFACGAECGVITSVAGTAHWNAPSGAPAISTTTVEPGGGLNAYRFNAAAAGVYHVLTVAQANLVGRIYFRFATLPSANTGIAYALSGANSAQVRVSPTGQVFLASNTATQNIGSVIAANEWHYVDYKFESLANMVVTARLDGGLEGTISSASAAANFTTHRIGVVAAVTADLFVDHILIANATADYPLGPGYIKGYTIGSTGTHNQTAGDLKDDAAANITDGDGSWAKVDEHPANTTDYAAQTVIRATTYAEYLYATSAEAGIPQAVEQIVNVLGGAANTEKSQLYDGTTATDAYALAATAAAITARTKHWTAAPTGVWTNARFQALRLRWGFSTDVTPNPRLSSSILEAAFPAARAPRSRAAGQAVNRASTY